LARQEADLLGGGVYTHGMQGEQFLTLLGHDVDYGAWPTSPAEDDPLYFRAWQRVSVALQRGMRQWISEFYFRDFDRFPDREAGFTMVAYSACRLFYGRPRTEFTYDVADGATLPAAVRSIGCPTERMLSRLETRLKFSGLDVLARRYSPVWYEDVVAAVKRRPKPFLFLIAREARLIDAVIGLGTSRDALAARCFSRAANSVLRNVLGVDMRELLPRVVQQTTITLRDAVRRFDRVVDRRGYQRDHVIASRSPDARVGGEENRNRWDAHGGSKVRDPGVVADVYARA
jgi:hypothetical protein